MKRYTQPLIDPLTTSFRQLKTMVGRTTGQKLPSAYALTESGMEPLFSYRHGDITITVYPNGFFLYEYGTRQTVYAVDRCRRMLYKYRDDEIRIIEVSQLDDGPCLIPLFMRGDERLEHNQDSYEAYWREFSLSSGQVPVAEPSVEDRYLMYLDDEESYAKFEAAWDTLTERQKQIFTLHRSEGMAIRRIADILHLSPSTVHETLQSAQQKLGQIFL